MLCTMCYAQEFNIKAIELDLQSLCPTHFTEWANEKMAYEFYE